MKGIAGKLVKSPGNELEDEKGPWWWTFPFADHFDDGTILTNKTTSVESGEGIQKMGCQVCEDKMKW